MFQKHSPILEIAAKIDGDLCCTIKLVLWFYANGWQWPWHIYALVNVVIYIHYSMVTALGSIVIQEFIFRNKILLLLLLWEYCTLQWRQYFSYTTFDTHTWYIQHAQTYSKGHLYIKATHLSGPQIADPLGYICHIIPCHIITCMQQPSLKRTTFFYIQIVMYLYFIYQSYLQYSNKYTSAFVHLEKKFKKRKLDTGIMYESSKLKQRGMSCFSFELNGLSWLKASSTKSCKWDTLL